MKILIVNTSDIHGGAARAAYRLHKALLNCKINSHMLVKYKSSNDCTITKSGTKIQKIIGKLRSVLDSFSIKVYRDRTKTLFSTGRTSFGNIINQINIINPDIVHLHWTYTGLISVEELTKIKAPIVWSLHDMWAFTGGCHYDEECGRYTKKCASCIVLGSDKENDLSTRIFNQKLKTYSQVKNMTIVGLSKWLTECSESSTLLSDKKHVNLPNPIDTNIFKPLNKTKARELWNLPKGKKLVLYGAMGATSDPRKGFDKLSEALNKLEDKDVEFMVYGSNEVKESQEFGFKTRYLGSIDDDFSLVTLYSAVDVMIVPSLQENLSNAIMESLACGTPVVGFDIGGNSDMIEHKTNGYLAKPFDTIDLKDGIKWVLNNKDYDILCENARAKVLREFDSIVIAKKYIKLYKDILKHD